MGDIAILLARLDSKRFPNKHFQKIGKKYVIDHCTDRLLKGKNYQIVLATSDRDIDNPLEAWAKDRGIGLFRGDASDIRKRIADCVAEFEAPMFARVNADSPFVDAELLDDGFKKMRESDIDLYTNLLHRSYPYGYSVEIFRSETFVRTLLDNPELEDVSTYFYKNAAKFKIMNKQLNNMDLSKIRLTVDTPDDLEYLRHLYAKSESLFSLLLHDILELLKTEKTS
jgi:spore coat polysaccharide biosynthesis protein SpsF